MALVGICAGLTLDLQVQDVPWESDGNLVGRIQTVSLFAGAICTIALAAILTAELAIRNGWEPKGLRVRFTGAIIADVEPDPDRFDYAWFTVALPNKQLERYLADPEESKKVRKGDCVMLEVIGQHVAEVRRMGGETAEALEAEAKTDGALTNVRRDASILRPAQFSLGPWLWTVLSPFLGGSMIGWQLLGFIHEQVFYRSRRGYSAHLLLGIEARAMAGLTILLGLIFIASSIISWKRGWNEDTGHLLSDRRKWLW